MEKYYMQVISAIINPSDVPVIKATKFVSPKQIVRAVRTTYRSNGRKPRKTDNIELTLTVGRPNYVEREFIKLCEKAKKPFPIKNVQLKLYNPKINKLKNK